jgi:GNAT superfamily N-acetyltransferase
MLIFERSVTRPYHDAMYKYIMRRLNTNRVQRIRNTEVMHIQGACTRTYAIIRAGVPVAWVYLGRRPTWCAWEVRQVFVHPDFRGQGLAGKIYRVVVNKHRLILASGKSQSKSSRALWLSFIKKNTFHIWAQDFNNLDLRSEVWVEDNELQSELEIYTRFATSRDVRLIAVRK